MAEKFFVNAAGRAATSVVPVRGDAYSVKRITPTGGGRDGAPVLIFLHEGLGAIGMWKDFPDALADALAFHHARDDQALADAKDPKLAALVRIANLAAHDDWTPEVETTPLSCVDEEAWALLLEYRNPLDENGRRELLNGFCQEVGGMAPMAL